MLPETPASLFMVQGHPLSAPALRPQPLKSAQEVPPLPPPAFPAQQLQPRVTCRPPRGGHLAPGPKPAVRDPSPPLNTQSGRWSLAEHGCGGRQCSHVTSKLKLKWPLMELI